jgi:hypothetical protein
MLVGVPRMAGHLAQHPQEARDAKRSSSSSEAAQRPRLLLVAALMRRRRAGGGAARARARGQVVGVSRGWGVGKARVRGPMPLQRACLGSGGRILGQSRPRRGLQSRTRGLRRCVVG